MASAPFAFASNLPPTIPGWTLIAIDTPGKNVFYGKDDSVKLDSKGISVLFQVVKEDSSVNYIVMFIGRNTCKAGYGEMTVSSVSGKIIGNSDYVKGGLSLGSKIGDFLCYGIEKLGK